MKKLITLTVLAAFSLPLALLFSPQSLADHAPCVICGSKNKAAYTKIMGKVYCSDEIRCSVCNVDLMRDPFVMDNDGTRCYCMEHNPDNVKTNPNSKNGQKRTPRKRK